MLQVHMSVWQRVRHVYLYTYVYDYVDIKRSKCIVKYVCLLCISIPCRTRTTHVHYRLLKSLSIKQRFNESILYVLSRILFDLQPKWSMGAKITIDSATMMNKGLEVIEAHFAFGCPYTSIEVLIHPQAIMHSAIELHDGAVLAQMGVPDMKLPIAYALTWPRRLK